MSVASISSWARPGCGPSCVPRLHDTDAHEAYGFRMGVESTRPVVVRTGPLVVDINAERASVDGAVVVLSYREWCVLAYLARNAGRFCRAQEIVSEMWEGVRGYHGAAHLGATTVKRLRDRVGGPAARLIETRIGFGYRLRLETPEGAS